MTTKSADPDESTGFEKVAGEAKERATQVERDYADGDDRPLSGYLRVVGIYGAAVAVLGTAGRLTGRRLVGRLDLADFALLSLGTHKMTRVIAKDAITSPFRAPFTKYTEPGGAGEVNEDVRARSEWGHAVGELLSCPFCLAVWTASGFMAGMSFAPRHTRVVATVFSITAVSDALQYAYSALKETEE